MQLSLIIAANRHKRVLWYRVIYIVTCIFPFPFLFHSLKHDGLIALLDDARNKRHPDFYLMSPNYTVFAVAAEHYKVADTLIYRLVRLSRSSRETKMENSRTRNITTDNWNVTFLSRQRGYATSVGLSLGMHDSSSYLGDFRSASCQRRVRLLHDGAERKCLDRYEGSWSANCVRWVLSTSIH